MKNLITIGGLLAAAGAAQAGVMNVDFSFAGDGVTPLVNGQAIDDEFSTPFSITSSGDNLGPAVFDTDPNGPNMNGPDEDLLVNLGNLLMLQSNTSPDQTTPGIFDVPNDSAQGGSIFFNFVTGIAPISLDLVDFDAGNAGTVTLTDVMGFTREYDIPGGWTNDIAEDGPDGFATLDLTILTPQLGENAGIFATAIEDAGFDPNAVLTIEVDFEGSGGLDNLTFIPTPGAAAFLAAAGLAGFARRRR